VCQPVEERRKNKYFGDSPRSSFGSDCVNRGVYLLCDCDCIYMFQQKITVIEWYLSQDGYGRGVMESWSISHLSDSDRNFQMSG
jgi:hypothetical protein